jgi:hypothetical protein
MPIRQQLDDDVKAAMLAHDAHRVETLRGLKTVILYADVATKTRDTGGIDDDAIMALFAKEAKKRQESADLYVQGGSQERADKELAEKAIIETYLPEQMSDEELGKLVDEAVAATGATEAKDMGRVIGAVKAKAGNAADGAQIAKLVAERLKR